MPLSFESESHGQIAFGFFNIESDMLLLAHYFFFATDFCRNLIQAAADNSGSDFSRDWPGYVISDNRLIGDLMGAIHGIHHTGFIGEVYRRFPFPAAPEDFKQRPEGDRTQAVMRELILKYGEAIRLPFRMAPNLGVVHIGEFRFDRPNFQALLQYVWQGGYPRWRDETPPAYVLDMKRRVGESRNRLFR